MNKIKEVQISNSVEGTIAQLEFVRSEIDVLKKLEDKIKDKLLEDFKDKIALQLQQKSEPFGVVNFQEGQFKISFTTPKKVKWDQDGLEKLAKEGAPVSVDYSVKESVYKEFIPYFIAYRTVEPGSVSIKIESVE